MYIYYNYCEPYLNSDKTEINLYSEWEFSSFFDLDMSYFITDGFQKASGESETFSS